MAFVNVGAVITKARTRLTGSIPRGTMVTWFNEVVDDILSQPREWRFLTDPLTLPIVGNTITLPAGVSELISIQIGEVFYDRNSQLSDKEAANPFVYGYTLSPAGVIAFYNAGGADLTGTAIVTVELDITSDYADDAVTAFPSAFQGLFISGIRKAAYSVDKDGRFTAEGIEYDTQMSQAKAWDNRLKPAAHFNRHGYIR